MKMPKKVVFCQIKNKSLSNVQKIISKYVKRINLNWKKLLKVFLNLFFEYIETNEAKNVKS